MLIKLMHITIKNVPKTFTIIVTSSYIATLFVNYLLYHNRQSVVTILSPSKPRNDYF